MCLRSENINLANRLLIGKDIVAILWDMDGVLIDSLAQDLEICSDLLSHHCSREIQIPPALIRKNFAYDLPEFWKRILNELDDSAVRNIDTLVAAIVTDHEARRATAVIRTNEGIVEILRAGKAAGLKMAVVSNNPTQDVTDMLSKCDLHQYFEVIVGNDIQQVRKKPAPDSYQLAARLMNVDTSACVVIEDSAIGAQAGAAAGCYTIGVATGAASLNELQASSGLKATYSSFRENVLSLDVGDVRHKKINTQNEFVSHMVEHVAWRMGCSIDLSWNNSDWLALGSFIGTRLKEKRIQNRSAKAIGIIDDGSAEVTMTVSDSPEVEFTSAQEIDLRWFHSLRCEQISSGRPLLDLLNGIASASGIRIEVLVCQLEDPHHTWEAIFRAIGICLRDMFDEPAPGVTTDSQPAAAGSAWTIGHSEDDRISVLRKTAESSVSVAIKTDGHSETELNVHVSDEVQVEEFSELLEIFAKAANIGLSIEFTATKLSSSHVVTEDIGIVLGRALKELLIRRMNTVGIDGAGCSLSVESDSPVTVAISFEGRNSCQIVPIVGSKAQLQKDFLIGKTIGKNLFSEDLDDFIYGMSLGMSSTINVHVHKVTDAEFAWRQLFCGLGVAWKKMNRANPMRRGVPPGVKATLD